MSKKDDDGTKGHTSPRYRDAGTGQFVDPDFGKANKGTTVKEQVAHPGYGDKSSFPIGRDAGTGRFMPVDDAAGKRGAVVERIPKKGDDK